MLKYLGSCVSPSSWWQPGLRVAGTHSGNLILAGPARKPIDSGQLPELIFPYSFPP
jgi:hypothetical protein